MSKKLFLLILFLYLFFLSIELMGTSFKLFGKEFSIQLIKITTNPFTALFIGILATSIIQSSSTTTSIVVALVASNTLSLRNAIPIIMGANVGTTITNTIVSFAYITRKQEFERAFASAIVHDFFNLLAVLIFLPLEMSTHFLEKSAIVLANLFVNFGGFKFISPLKVITSPILGIIKILIPMSWLLLSSSLILLFSSLTMLVKTLRSMVLEKMELILNDYLFKTPLISFFLGLMFTAIIQSSSVTTSLMIPLVGAGLLTIRKIFPYTLGANVGTTVTAIMASLVTNSKVAVTIAFTHLLFNLFGVVVIYPIREVPIKMAEYFSSQALKSKWYVISYVIIIFFIIPLLLIYIGK